MEKKARDMAESDFGADMPVLGFISYNNIVIYDDYGIYIFNLLDDKLCGYFDFEENGLGGLQGSNATFVYVSADGSNIYINGKRKSLFMKLTVGFIERKSLIKQSWICGNRKKLLNQ